MSFCTTAKQKHDVPLTIFHTLDGLRTEFQGLKTEKSTIFLHLNLLTYCKMVMPKNITKKYFCFCVTVRKNTYICTVFMYKYLFNF